MTNYLAPPVQMVTLCCANCDVPFAITKDFEKRRREDRRHFMCPNGHSNVFEGENEAEKLRRQLQISQQQIARAEDEARAADREAAQAKKELRRVHKRINAGVCPCCNRTFENLARHMKSKHPNVTPITASAAAPAHA